MRSARLLPGVLFGCLTGMRSMSACAALAWTAARGGTQPGWRWAARLRWPATALAAAEMAGDKLPGAPDRRIAPSFLLRAAIGGAGAEALGGSAVVGVAAAFAGTLLGRAARGATTRSARDWKRALAEDATAATLAIVITRHHRPRARLVATKVSAGAFAAPCPPSKPPTKRRSSITIGAPAAPSS